MDLAHRALCIATLALILPVSSLGKKPEALSIGPFETEVSQESFLATLIDPACKDGPKTSTICEGSFPGAPDIKVRGDIYANLLESVTVTFSLDNRAYVENEIVRKNGKARGGIAGWAIKKAAPTATIWTGKNRGESILMLMCDDKFCSAVLQGRLAIKRYKECKKEEGELARFFC